MSAICILFYRRQRRLERQLKELRQERDSLARQALHDPLTDLPNRALFMNRLERALARSLRYRHPVAVLFLDLDRFKTVNDRWGHGMGDQLLIAVGQRLQAWLRPEDTVARFGGDEFVIVLEDVRDASGAELVAKRILQRLQEPIWVGGQQLSVTTSIGITLSTTGRERPEELLYRADTAMYQAKYAGRARYKVYDLRSGEDTS